MLIRLAGHYINNPNHIDKLICIKGLPEEWLFRPSRFGGKELMPPWIPDIEANIPAHIRHLCEPTEVTFVFPPVEKGKDYLVDKRTILGLKFDYMTEPGQVLWDKIERYLDRMTPRDEKVPAPVIVAPNQKSDFAPHEARRTVRGSLEFRSCEIPMVDLRRPILESLVNPISQNIPEPVATTNLTVGTVTIEAPVIKTELVKDMPELKCDHEGCTKTFDKPRALAMHKLGAHRVRKETQPIGV